MTKLLKGTDLPNPPEVSLRSVRKMKNLRIAYESINN